MTTRQLRGLFKRLLLTPLYRKLVYYTRNPPVGRVDLGDLTSTRPASDVFGLDRGQPVDRYYINRFLAAYEGDIRGRVLEIGDNRYTVRYGGDHVDHSDVLHVSEQSEKVTIVADLTRADQLTADQFDCVICTQTLQFIYAVDTAIATLHRILKPGGIVLVTCPGISQISRYDMDHWGDYWRFTSASILRLFGACFEADHVSISIYGNVLAAVAFLHGLAVEDLELEKLDVFDPDYEVLVGVRAVKTKKSL